MRKDSIRSGISSKPVSSTSDSVTFVLKAFYGTDHLLLCQCVLLKLKLQAYVHS